jgi:hypothetical protein
MNHPQQLIDDYIGQAVTTSAILVESNLVNTGDIPFQRIKLLIDEGDVEISAFGIMYSVGLLSFLQARPAGISAIDYQEEDAWYPEDFHRHVSFRQGKLHFYADYVRGRLMKTTIEISKDGSIVIETINRGDQATQWAEFLLGKRTILEFINGKALGTVQ